MKGIAVTGMGIISSIGLNLEETLNSFRSGKDGIGFSEILKTNHKNLPVGEIKLKNSELGKSLKLPSDHAYTRAALLAVFAIQQLLENTGLDKFPEDTGFISGTSVGGIDKTEQHFYDYENNPEYRKYIQAQHPGFTTEKIAAYFGLKEIVTTISTACSSSANAIMMGAQMIESGKLKRVIVGGSDCLTRFTLNGFNSLMILSKNKCKAFDDDRDGLNLGEAAAYILLEADDSLQDRKVSAKVAGYGNANDAFHQTASSKNGEGAYKAMSKAIRKAGISAEQIDYINAHGTGTKNNDLSESVALKRIFGNELPHFSSTKGFTGHTLGAAGAVEAVFSILSLQNREIYKNLHFQKEMNETGLKPLTENRNKDLNYVLSNSFGFGGNCTSLIFKSNE